MATFHGFKITNMHSWTGHEGYGVSGTLYCGRTRLGNFIDYGDGGIVNYEFPCEALNKDVVKHLPNLCTDLYGEKASWMTPDLDIVILHLADLADREKLLRKQYRSAARKNLVLASAYVDHQLHTATAPITFSDDAIRASVQNHLVNDFGITAPVRVDIWRKTPTIVEGDPIPMSDEAKAEAVRHRQAEAKYRARRDAMATC